MSEPRWPGGGRSDGVNGQSPVPFAQRMDPGGQAPCGPGGIPGLSPIPGVGGSPFEEPERSPELARDRSRELYDPNNAFWSSPDGQSPPQNPPREPGNEYPQDPNYLNHPPRLDQDNAPKVRKKGFFGSGIIKVLLAIVALLCVGALVFGFMCRIRHIRVEGNSRFTDQQIIGMSRLKLGDSSHINELEVKNRIEQQEPGLICTLVNVEKLDTVVIHVKERIPAAYILHGGWGLTVDLRGMILEMTENMAAPHDGLIEVSGLALRRMGAGERITPDKQEALLAYQEIFLQLQIMKGRSQIRELDLTNLDSISMVAEDGMTIDLGDTEKLHEKLRAMLVVREYLAEKGYWGGRLNVTDPEKPVYAPPSV